MRFCVYCGDKLEDEAKAAFPFSYRCPQCEATDDLNVTHCVICGAKLSLNEGRVRNVPAKKTGFNWSVADQQSPALRWSNKPKAAVRANERLFNSVFGLIAMLGGIVLGLATTTGLFVGGVLPYALARCAWPKGGLVVYGPAPAMIKGGNPNLHYQVLLTNTDSGDMTVATIGSKLASELVGPASKAAGCVFLPKLKGKYRLSVTADGYDTAVGMVDVTDSHPTVIGYPDGINLEKSMR
jgi:hypothetical protein